MGCGIIQLVIERATTPLHRSLKLKLKWIGVGLLRHVNVSCRLAQLMDDKCDAHFFSLGSVDRGATSNRQTSVVECREQLKLIGLLFVMIDEQRRLVDRDHLPDFFHRRDRFFLIGVEGRNDVVLEILFRMNDVAGQYDEAEFLRRTSSDWLPGVCPGVETKVRLSSPNTSVSPSMS